MNAALPVLLVMFGLGATAPVPKLRRDAPMTARFPDMSLQEILERLGGAAGVKMIFDPSFRDKNVTWAADEETFDATLRKMFLVHGKAGREIQPDVIVVYEDQPPARRKYDAFAPSGPVAAVRRRVPIRLAFADTSLQKVIEALAREADLTVIFDESFRDQNVNIRFDGETFEAALDQLALPYNFFFQELDTRSIVVAAEQPTARRKYAFHDIPALVEPASLGCGEARPAEKQARASSVRFADGLELHFVTGFVTDDKGFASYPFYRRTETVTLAGGLQAVDRIVGDMVTDRTRVRSYVGYRLQLQRSKGNRSFRVEVQPLPEASWKRMCASCPPQAQAKIERYPEPFDLGSGGSFTLDLMTARWNGRAVVDQIDVLSSPMAPAGDKPARRFKVEWTMAREVDHLRAGVCIRDLESGRAIGGFPGLPIVSWSDSLSVAEQGRTRDGKPLTIVARVSPAEDRRTVAYAVELWEAGELTHMEETRLPLVLF